MSVINPLQLRILVIDRALLAHSAEGAFVREIVSCLQDREFDVVETGSIEEGMFAILSDPSIDCICINWDLVREELDGETTQKFLSRLRMRNEQIPVFLITERTALSSIPLEVIREINEYIWTLEDTPLFIAGRIEAAAAAYHQDLFPPFFRGLIRFSQVHEYSWHTPGHAGGIAFLKSPIGTQFHRFLGEPVFRSDISISVEELGSLLVHSKVIGEAERNAARIFGADQSYFVTNGTSTSNKIVFFGTVVQGDRVLVDRNCHKSVEHALTMTGAIPVYLTPTRNRYGIIGPIPPSEMTPKAIQEKLRDHPLIPPGSGSRPSLAIITNSTYDGLCYRVTRVNALLGQSVDRIQYDEAWYAYARFNPLYTERYGMHDTGTDGPTIFATQSTHKLLAAFSQASLIHVKQGRAPIEHNRFNEAFMMHTTTSPFYPIIAANDVSAKMMEGSSGLALTNDSIDEAIAFRKMMEQIRRKLLEQDPRDWWFGLWQPDEVIEPGTGHSIAFADATDDLLRTEPDCWVLHPGQTWHGFGDIEDGYCMLDPIKVTLLSPGVAEDGSLQEFGIPAEVVSRFLDAKGIVVEKTGPYIILFLFSMGITRGKWGTLITELFEFKRLYQENAPLEEVLPDLVTLSPETYRGMGLADLCKSMHRAIREMNLLRLMDAAFDQLPDVVMNSAEAYRNLVQNRVEQVPVDAMESRVVAVGVVPYPPGIPVLMPGEEAGKKDGPILQYLHALQEFDGKFPGFEHEIHGVERKEGIYRVFCIQK